VPELRRLRTFVAVAEELNFTRAAARLHLAQQAVSKSVRRLEEELGVELLERTTREVHLTPAGAALLDAGRPALAAADAAFARAREVGRGTTGTVRVGVSPALGPADRDAVVAALRRDAPALAVSVREVRPGEVPAALRDRAVDLVVSRTSSDAPEVDSAALRPTRAALYVPAAHPLAREQAVALARLDGERVLVWNPPGTAFTDLLLGALRAAGAAVEPVEARITGTHRMTEVAERRVVALLPEGWPADDGVAEVALADALTLPLVVQWPAGLPSPAVARLRAALSSGA
jgi:DNA-binding transcriptional LysR family regulator